MLNLKKILLSFIIGLTFLPSLTFAQITLNEEYKPSYAPSIILKNQGKPGSEADYGNYLLQFLASSLLYLAAPVAVVVIAIGGLLYVSSRGEQGQMDKAKKTITWAIIGLIVMIFSYTLVRAVIEIVYNTNQQTATSQTQNQNTNPAAPPGQTSGESGNQL